MTSCYHPIKNVYTHIRGGGQGGGVGLSPPPPPAPSSPSSLLERRALRARKIFLLFPPSLFFSPLPPPAPSSPSSRPLFSLLPPPRLPPPAPSSPLPLTLSAPSYTEATLSDLERAPPPPPRLEALPKTLFSAILGTAIPYPDQMIENLDTRDRPP